MSLTIRDTYCCNKLMSHCAFRANDKLKLVYLCQTCGDHKVVHIDG